jgi:hypothetical protein
MLRTQEARTAWRQQLLPFGSWWGPRSRPRTVVRALL